MARPGHQRRRPWGVPGLRGLVVTVVCAVVTSGCAGAGPDDGAATTSPMTSPATSVAASGDAATPTARNTAAPASPAAPTSDRLTTLDLETRYDALRAAATCLESQGLVISQPPSLADFRASWPDRAWDPFEDLRGFSEDERARLETACPRPPPP